MSPAEPLPHMALIIPAAGSGSRMGSKIPKPFLPFGKNNEPVIFTTIASLKRYSAITETILILPPDRREELLNTYGKELEALGVTATVPGGSSRQESVASGLSAIKKPCDLIGVHDAVRPFISLDLMERLAAAALRYGGSLPVWPVTDTIKRVSPLQEIDNTSGIDGVICETVPREGLYAVQTPQIFKANILTSSYAKAKDLGETITDDASLVEAAGGRVAGVRGDRFNIKLTTPEDLQLASALIAAGIIN